jgi:transcriptional regulator with PAS, ATPase and Fis domain
VWLLLFTCVETMNALTQNLGIIGSSPLIQEAIERLREVAPTDLTVLISGESGTGKEVFAQAIHALSKRRVRRMVSINCGAIPETLLESELFGSEKGAFTGSTEQRKGFFEAADRSTIFLDELGEMPLGTQVKLLRVLETGEFSRLGSPEALRTDVRVIAATNRRLEEEVARGSFRHDLFYRLNTVQIQLPALREHPDDIPELVLHFAGRTATKIGAPFEGIESEAMRILQNLPWSGNIRELRNMVETVVTLGKGHRITAEMLRPYLPKALKQPEIVTSPPNIFSNDALYESSPFLLPQNISSRNPQEILQSEYVQNERNEVFSRQPITLVRIPHKTPEQAERELMYKALLDLVREVASLRGEIAEIKDVLYADGRANDGEIAHESEGSQQGFKQGFKQGVEQELEPLTMQAVEKRLIASALERYDGNRRQTAEALGISERTLYRKLHEYGIETGRE